MTLVKHYSPHQHTLLGQHQCVITIWSHIQHVGQLSNIVPTRAYIVGPTQNLAMLVQHCWTVWGGSKGFDPLSNKLDQKFVPIWLDQMLDQMFELFLLEESWMEFAPNQYYSNCYIWYLKKIMIMSVLKTLKVDVNYKNVYYHVEIIWLNHICTKYLTNLLDEKLD